MDSNKFINSYYVFLALSVTYPKVYFSLKIASLKNALGKIKNKMVISKMTQVVISTIYKSDLEKSVL